MFIVFVVSFEICGQELHELFADFRFCAGFKQNTETGVPDRTADIDAECAFGIAVEAARKVRRNRRKAVNAVQLLQEFRIVGIIFRRMIKGNHAVRQQAAQSAQRKYMILMIGAFPIRRDHFLFLCRFAVEFREPFPQFLQFGNRCAHRIAGGGYRFRTFPRADHRRAECFDQSSDQIISRVIALDLFNRGNTGIQKCAVPPCPGIQVSLQIRPECGFSVHAVGALGIALAGKLNIVAASAFQNRIADIAGFLPLRRKTVRQRLIREIRFIEFFRFFKGIRSGHGADPFEHHPVTGRNVFIFRSEHLRTHGLDISRHDDTDVVHEVSVVVARNNGSGRMFFIQYNQAVLLRKQAQRVCLPVIGFGKQRADLRG